MKRVKVDFSTTVQDGLIRANQARASELLQVGDEVVAFDPAEDIEFVGVVDHLSDDGRFAFLRMEWEDNTPVPCNVAGQNFLVTSFSAPEITVEFQPETSLERGEGAYVSTPQAGPAQPFVTTIPA